MSRSWKWTGSARISSSACRRRSAARLKIGAAAEAAVQGERSRGTSPLAGGPYRDLYLQAARHRREALPAGPDAGALVPLQPGLLGLWQDRLSRRDSEPAPELRSVHGGDRRVRR